MTPQISEGFDPQKPIRRSLAQILMLQHPGVRMRDQHRI